MLPGQTNQLQQAAALPDRPLVQVDIVAKLQAEQWANPGAAGDRTLVCECCKRLFRAPVKLSGYQRTSNEYEMLRRALLITDHTALPVFCDGCYEQAIVPPEQHAGYYPNLVLEKLNVQPPRE